MSFFRLMKRWRTKVTSLFDQGGSSSCTLFTRSSNSVIRPGSDSAAADPWASAGSAMLEQVHRHYDFTSRRSCRGILEDLPAGGSNQGADSSGRCSKMLQVKWARKVRYGQTQPAMARPRMIEQGLSMSSQRQRQGPDHQGIIGNHFWPEAL